MASPLSVIVAINKDSATEMMRVADYALEPDLYSKRLGFWCYSRPATTRAVEVFEESVARGAVSVSIPLKALHHL